MPIPHQLFPIPPPGGGFSPWNRHDLPREAVVITTQYAWKNKMKFFKKGVAKKNIIS